MIQEQSIVVFKNPNPDEIFNGEPLRFQVVELNGDRCLIEPVTSDLYPIPQQVVKVEDLEEV